MGEAVDVDVKSKDSKQRRKSMEPQKTGLTARIS
jgi:hypothetical protein